MAINGLLTQRCDIAARQGPSDLKKNRMGLVVAEFETTSDGSPVLKASDVPVRSNSKNIFEKYTDRSLGVVQEMYILFFAPGTDVGESDRIVEIRDALGNVIAKNLDVTGVRNIPGRGGRLHHLEATAFEYRTGASILWEQ